MRNKNKKEKEKERERTLYKWQNYVEMREEKPTPNKADRVK